MTVAAALVVEGEPALAIAVERGGGEPLRGRAAVALEGRGEGAVVVLDMQR